MSRKIHLKDRRVPTIQIPNSLTIDLTETEETICNLLNDCKLHLEREKGISTTCRIAGGWVRDKLLGSQSNDIDIALSDMMGVAFAEQLHPFAVEKGVEIGKIATVEANPDQSKHLETATMKVLGLPIDFVNLRSEEYAEGSRIPTQISFGTPLEDALRRDITINAMFYNVHTRSVEDHTGKGLDDLKNGIVRTPLKPVETFLDDPLRILRCIRFASRFGFAIAPEIFQAVLDPDVQQALVAKVTRERIGIEVDKMLRGRDPLGAISLIFELGLFPPIFHIPHKDVPVPSPEAQQSARSAAILFYALQSPADDSQLPLVHPLLLSRCSSDLGHKAMVYLACMMLPYASQAYKDHKNKTHSVADLMVREAVKLGVQNHYLDGVPVLLSGISLTDGIFARHNTRPLSRLELGLFLRDRSIHYPNTGTFWTTSLLWALINKLVPLYDLQSDTLNVERATETINHYNKFVSLIEELDLPKDVDARPLLTGKEIMTSLGQAKPGPFVGRAMEDVVKWQLEHPQGTKEECLAWLQSVDSSIYLSVPENTPPTKKPRVN